MLPSPVAKSDDEGETISPEDLLSREQRFQKWQSQRPPIGHLPEAIHVPSDGSDPVPLFDVGDRIVVDCLTDLLDGLPWLQTVVGKVRSIDDTSGLVSVYDESTDARNPMVKWVSFKSNMFTLKLAPAHGNPFEPPVPDRQPKPQPAEGKRSKGRPKGSLNRSKAVVKAEKEARKAEREAKRAKREARKAQKGKR